MGSEFKYYVWDAPLLILQMLAVQGIFYSTFGLLLLPAAHAIGADLSLGLVFFDNAPWQVLPCYLLNSLVLGVVIWRVVERSRQCLDFTCTCYFAHLLACSYYTGRLWPSITTLVATAACVTTTTVLAEYLCLHANLGEIQLRFV